MSSSNFLQMNEQPTGAVVEAPLDDGYVSPEFDLPDLPSDEEEGMALPPSKRNKFDFKGSKHIAHDDDLDDDEELALRLLGRA